MERTIAPVVPANSSRAKRIAKQLKSAYPNQQLSNCQAATAKLFGHKDWHALEQAIEKRLASAPFDEELSEEDLATRRTLQADILCRDLGGIDPYGSYESPADPPHKEAMSESEFATYMAARDGQKMMRFERAFARWHVLFSIVAVLELQPTTAKVPPAVSFAKFMTLYDAEQIKELPLSLGRWWKRNIPYQPGVAEALSRFELDPDSQISLMKFGAYWGELCFHYAHTIDWMMAMGVGYLIAERFGTIYVQDSGAIEDAHSRIAAGVSNDEEKFLLKEVSDIFYSGVGRFFAAYPRDDFGEAFKKQPGAFQANAKEAIKVLASPRSKKGIWNHSR